MTSWPRFKALWTHRFHKYTHIGGKFLSAWWKVLALRRRKVTLGKRQLVAIVLSEQMGDIVACEPVARAVRQQHPDAYILWFVRESYRSLVANNPALDGYLLEKCPGERTRILQSGVFDRIYNLHLSHRKCQYCAEDPINANADRLQITYANYYDYGNLLYVFSQVAGLPPLDDDPVVYIDDASRHRVDTLNIPAGAVVIHCKSSDVARDWQTGHWNRLVQTLLDEYQVSVIEVGLQPIVQCSHPRFQTLCGQLSLLETAEVIRQARLFIGIDSGPAHFANAVGTPGVVMLGKHYAFSDYLPYSGRYKRGEGVIILNKIGYPCSAIPFDEVIQAVEEQLNVGKKV